MIVPESFHFLRPAWLLASLGVVAILWRAFLARRGEGSWAGVCDPALLRHLLVPGNGRGSHWPTLALALAWLAVTVALAGPTWERLPQPTYRMPVQTAAVLDLSPSMRERDVAPSRVARARYELLDLLERTDGSVGLVIFAEDAYAAVPVTDDPRVIAEMVPVLEPGLMPGRGKRLDRGIDRARELLVQAGATRGRIVVIGDGLGEAPEAARAAAGRARAAGFPVSTLDVADGPDDLAELAEIGGGRHSGITADDRDIERVLAAGPSGPDLGLASGASASDVKTDAWRDVGAWLLWIPLLLAPLAFRKGWATAIGLLFLVSLDAPPAAADLWARPDQRAAEAFSEGRHAEAAELFEDPAWRASAHYRAGDYDAAAAALEGLSDSEAHYNRGNALAHSGRLEDALAAYDQALEQQPDHADAQHNRALVEELLRQQQQQQQQSPPSGSPSPESSENGAGNDSASGSPESGAGDEADAAAGQDGIGEDAEASENDGREAAAGSEASDGERSAAAGAGQPGDDAGDPSDAAPEAAAGPETPASQAARAEDGAEGADAAEPPAAGQPGADETGSGPADRSGASMARAPLTESDQEIEQWLNRVPDDPGGLLREKLRRRYVERRTGSPGGVRR